MPCTWRADRSQVAEPFATHLTDLLEADPADWVVVCGTRDRATEAAGYAAYLADPEHAPKFTNPDNSAHCKVPAEACDVTLRTSTDGKSDVWDYQHPDWRRLVAAVDASPNLHSLDSIGDTDHVEATAWRSL